jgi:anti-anti-sigma factor
MRLHLWAVAGNQQIVFHCAGDIIYKREADLLLGAVSALRSKRTIIDLEQVRTIDAYGLGKIVYIYKLLCTGDTEVIFLNPNEHVRKLFRLLKLEFCLERNWEKKFEVQDGRKTIPGKLKAWEWSRAS